MSADEHRSRHVYGRLADALDDADELLAELGTSGTGDHLLVSIAEIEFTARRARQLVQAVARELNTRSIE